jgi:hypothetical protein
VRPSRLASLLGDSDLFILLGFRCLALSSVAHPLSRKAGTIRDVGASCPILCQPSEGCSDPGLGMTVHRVQAPGFTEVVLRSFPTNLPLPSVLVGVGGGAGGVNASSILPPVRGFGPTNRGAQRIFENVLGFRVALPLSLPSGLVAMGGVGPPSTPRLGSLPFFPKASPLETPSAALCFARAPSE